MLDVASISLVDELNTYIQNRVSQNENKVVLSGILDQNGKVAVEENKIVATLIDIHQETTLINNQQYRPNGDNGVVRASPTVHLNLIMLFSAYFSVNNYKEGLKYLSYVVSFFQGKPTFTQQNTQGLRDSLVEKLVVQIYHLDTNTKNNMWNSLGLKYMPSILYKVRMLSFVDMLPGERVETVSGLDTKS